MMMNEDDRIVRTLARLPSLEPSVNRTRQTRSRCHATLESRRQRKRPIEPQRSGSATFVDVLLLVGLAVYLGGAVGEAVWLSAFF
jgi:hypothetical protein